MPKLQALSKTGPKIDKRCREARRMETMRRELVAHVGGNPSVTQSAIIERIVWLGAHLARLDERAIAEGGLSDHAARQYLAWANTQARLLKLLGLGKPVMPKRTIVDVLAERRAAAAE